jgi:hypothetical protein
VSIILYLCNLFKVAVEILLNLLAGLSVENLLPRGNLFKAGGAQREDRLHSLLDVVQSMKKENISKETVQWKS